jgi:hypothetical protein
VRVVVSDPKEIRLTAGLVRICIVFRTDKNDKGSQFNCTSPQTVMTLHRVSFKYHKHLFGGVILFLFTPQKREGKPKYTCINSKRQALDGCRRSASHPDTLPAGAEPPVANGQENEWASIEEEQNELPLRETKRGSSVLGCILVSVPALLLPGR